MMPEQTVENPSHELDMEPFFSETGAMAEMECLAIQGILESNGIPFTVAGSSSLPMLEFTVSVPRSRMADAKKALEEARSAGESAALEAEMQGELGELEGQQPH